MGEVGEGRWQGRICQMRGLGKRSEWWEGRGGEGGSKVVR